MHLAAIPSPPPPPPEKIRRNAWFRYSADEIRREHDGEHGNVGLNVRLTMEDLERLNLWLQPPSGGGIDDPPLKIGDYLWSSLYSSTAPPTATILVEDVEREVRRHLELELLMAGADQDQEDVSTDEEESATAAFSQLSLSGSDGEVEERAKQPEQGYHKELSYTHMRGTTILLKPNSHETSSGASAGSGDQHYFGGGSPGSTSRLHDLAISDCSDVNMYLLQPFEHVTIAACTGCTIVVGAVAGLLHVVDCEKTTIISAARRIVVSNSSDVVLCVFTPSPPLLVGDNRNCQFAPYNTYYDGFREDLLATGLAAAAVSENQSPYHQSSRSVDGDVAAWPPLQCASNKWKQPIEISKLEIPQVPSTPGSTGASSPQSGSPASSSPGADDKAGDSMHAPVLLPASEFHVLFVPLENDSMKQKKPDNDQDGREGNSPTESQYCRVLAEVLQMSPFRLPVEYERSALVKADRMRSIQQTVRKSLSEEQQMQFEEELNRGFRDWLVTSGNLRQVLDLVHLERRGGL